MPLVFTLYTPTYILFLPYFRGNGNETFGTFSCDFRICVSGLDGIPSVADPCNLDLVLLVISHYILT